MIKEVKFQLSKSAKDAFFQDAMLCYAQASTVMPEDKYHIRLIQDLLEVGDMILGHIDQHSERIHFMRTAIMEQKCYQLQAISGSKNKKPYVYLVKSPDTGYVKIGFSTDPKTRISQIQCNRSRKVEVVALFAGTLKDEASLHKIYKSKRIRGEWFDLSREDIEAIKRDKVDLFADLHGKSEVVSPQMRLEAHQ